MAPASLKRSRHGRRLGAAGALAAVVIALVLVSPVLAGSRGPGHLDRSFGDGGLLKMKRARGHANAVDVGRKGRIVVAGVNAVARLQPNGHLDRAFGKRGLVRLESGAYAGAGSSVALGSSSVAVGAKGTVFVAGASCAGSLDCDFAVSRLTPTGELDRSFGQGGTARIGFQSPINEALSIAIESGKRLVVGGVTCEHPGHCGFALARLDRNGKLDPSFGDGGRIVGSGRHCYPGLGGMALDSRERIVVGRSCDAHVASLARFTLDGKLDPSFGDGGRVTRKVALHDVDDLAVDSHDRIDLAGRYLVSAGVVRFGRSGGFDSSFGRHGVARAHKPHDHGLLDPTSIALDSRGRIVVVSRTLRPRGFSFARFKPDGHVNRRFGHDGTQLVGHKERFRESASVAIDRRDRIVGVGRQERNRHQHFALARLLG